MCEWQERARCKGEEQSKRWQKGIQLGEPRRMLRDISSQLGRKLAATVAVTLAGRIGLADERASKRCDFRCGSQLSGRLAETGRADDARHHRSGSGTAASGMEAASRQAHIPQARRLHFGRPTLFFSICLREKEGRAEPQLRSAPTCIALQGARSVGASPSSLAAAPPFRNQTQASLHRLFPSLPETFSRTAASLPPSFRSSSAAPRRRRGRWKAASSSVHALLLARAHQA